MRALCAYLRVMRGMSSLMVAVLGLALSAMPVLAPAQQAERAIVVELFTSQGCSSCPPADDVLAQISGRDDVVALSLHVDYWDYLGWRDTFAQRQFTERQIAYRDEWHKTVIYTPQMVVMGVEDVRGSSTNAVVDAIERAQAADAPVNVSIERDGGMLKCRINPVAGQVSGTVWIAKYNLSESVAIQRGENAGREITYRHVVRSLNRIGTWTGAEPEEVAMPQPEPGEGVAIWIQHGDAGPIMAAAKIENPVD